MSENRKYYLEYKEARKSDNLLKRDFTSNVPLKKCVTDITELKAKDGKLYISGIFDCYNLMQNGVLNKILLYQFGKL